MSLLRAELDRLLARRLVRLMFVLLLVAFGITVATTLAASTTPTSAQLATATQQAEQERLRAELNYRDCLAAQSPGPAELREQFPPFCPPVDPADYRPENYVPGAFVFEREIEGLLYFQIAFLALFGFVVAASFIGTELASGGVTNLLLWESRRSRVLGAKLGVILAAVAVVAVVSTALFVGAFWVIAEVAGLPGRMTGQRWGWLVLTALRGLGTVLGAAVGGFAIATLGRHTAAALGAVAAYAVLWEAGARVVMTVVDTSLTELWMLSTYLGAWTTGTQSVFNNNCRYNYEVCTIDVYWGHAAAVFGVLLAALLGTAFRSFDRRDLI